MNKQVTLTLTHDEPWILFEFPRRFSEIETLSIEDQAEERPLWTFCCLFEKTLSEPKHIRPQQHIEQYRARLRDQT